MRRIVGTNVSRMLVLAGALAIIITCFVAYVPAMKSGFIWDDDFYVTSNPLMTSADGLYHIWFSKNPKMQYFPLIYTTFRFEHKLWGFNPAGYHTVNIIIHIINALLLWMILRRLSIPGAWFASAVFALHPVQVESVAWVTELKNLMMLFFSLLSVLCWIEFALGNKPARKAILFYVGSLLLYVLALFSKTTACTLPAALVLILWLKRSPLTLKRWLQILPFVVIGVGIGLIVMNLESQNMQPILEKMGIGSAGKLLIAGRALWFYLWKIFWPANLTFSYPFWQIDPSSLRQYLWPAAYALLLLCLWFRRKKLGRGALTAALFFAATLFPMLSFFALYTFVYTFVADHYQYAACIGPITLVSAGGALVFQRLNKNQKPVLILVAGAILLTLGTLTWRQSRIYTNLETLWRDTLNKNPDSWLAHGQIAQIYYKQGKFNEALMHEKKRLEFSSFMEKVEPSSLSKGYFTVALILEAQGKLDDADDYYKKSLAIVENDVARHFRLGEVLARQGKFEEAILHFRRAIEIEPRCYDAYLDWGTMFWEQAKAKGNDRCEQVFNEVCDKYKKALDIKPDLYKAYINWGTVLMELAKMRKDSDPNLLKEASVIFIKSEEIQKGSSAYNLACVWAILGDENQCSKWLKVGQEQKTLPTRKDAFADPDLKSMRDKEWFKNIRFSGE
ncbi:MAG: tetratricopeptide repeat protein [Sedimentisphaerales bacterium]